MGVMFGFVWFAVGGGQFWIDPRREDLLGNVRHWELLMVGVSCLEDFLGGWVLRGGLWCYRRLLVFPKGNESQRGSDHVAVYLDFPEASYTPQQMCPKAHFELIAVNQDDGSKSIQKGEKARNLNSGKAAFS